MVKGPDEITLSDCERAIGEPAKSWAGRCFEIASRLVDAGLVRGTAVYGHWIGPVHPRSHFGGRHGTLFVQHGWIVLTGDARVLDPTRWAFERKRPYLYLGAADHYDEGGNGWRAATQRPVPEFDPAEKSFDVPKEVMDSKTWTFVERLLRIDSEQEVGTLTFSQLFWLANAPLDQLGPHARGVYGAIEKLGEEALVPVDNFMRVKGGRWP